MLLSNSTDYSKGFFIRLLSNYSKPTKLSKIFNIAMGREDYRVYEVIQFVQTELNDSIDGLNFRVLVSLFGAVDGLHVIDMLSRKSNSFPFESKNVNRMKVVTFERVYLTEDSVQYQTVYFMNDEVKYTIQFKNDYLIASVMNYQFNYSSQQDYRFFQNH